MQQFISVFMGRMLWWSFFLLLCAGGFFSVFSENYFKHFDNILKRYKGTAVGAHERIFFREDSKLPYISYSLIFPKAGTQYDGLSNHKKLMKNGLAYITAQLLKKGTNELDAETFQKQLANYGTDLRVSVGRKSANISVTSLSWHAEKVWELFIKAASEPRFEVSELKLLKSQLTQSRALKLSHPASFISEIWINQVFKGSEKSSGSPSRGTLASIKNIQMEDVKRFYESRYKKGNPLLAVVGKFDRKLKETVKTSFKKNFAFFLEKEEELTDLKIKPFFFFLSHPETRQSQVVVGYPLFPYPKDNPRLAVAMGLANNVFGGDDMSSRLMSRLRVARGLTYGVSSSLSLSETDGFFSVSGSTGTETTGEFLRSILSLMERFEKEGILSLEELKKSKSVYKSGYFQSRETATKRLSQWISFVHFLKVDPSFIRHFTKIVSRISLEEVNVAIQNFIQTEKLQILVYGHPSVKSQLEDFKALFPLKEISFDEYFKEELQFLR